MKSPSTILPAIFAERAGNHSSTLYGRIRKCGQKAYERESPIENGLLEGAQDRPNEVQRLIAGTRYGHGLCDQVNSWNVVEYAAAKVPRSYGIEKKLADLRQAVQSNLVIFSYLLQTSINRFIWFETFGLEVRILSLTNIIDNSKNIFPDQEIQ
jgi:hypothetical protein